MKNVVTLFSVLCFSLLLTLSARADDRFDRAAVIPARAVDNGGFGNIVAGVDFDRDGKVEIYAVNNDWQDVVGGDLVPRIYKYEQNTYGDWEVVWWTRLDFSFQNTWPAMAPADLDQDGKYEIVWGPVNNLAGGANPNPPRIVVFETPGDGSDVMGIDNDDGTFSPNAEWTIVDEDNFELRPFRWFIHDIDDDGVDEIVTALRRGNNRAQIYSVDDVPDNGDGSETWTREFAGLGAVTHYDLAVIDSTAYYISSGGDVTPVTWSASGDSFRVGDTQATLVPGGSWKSASAVDIDGDGSQEIVVATWFADEPENKSVLLLQPDGNGLTATTIADYSDLIPYSRVLNGGDYGDLDGDGNVDFVFGARDFDSPQGPTSVVVRLAYRGGDITSPDSYERQVLDSGIIDPNGGQVDVIEVADVDGDGEDNVLYAGVTRPFGSGPPVLPITILDRIARNQPKIVDVQDVPNDQGRQVWVVWEGAGDDVGGTRLTAELSGDNEVPPVTTAGTGKARFILNEDQTELSFLLEVANVDSVTQAHIHQGSAGENGPVGVFLFGLVEGGGPVNGVLSSGTITEDDLIGPWEGDLSAFLNDLLTGNTYVNVHTTTNPPGEIRGQILVDPLTKGNQNITTSGYTITHYVVWRIDNGMPVQVASVDAIQAGTYAAVVPTLADGDTTESTYVVSAHTPKPHVLWKSFPKTGFSLDNLAPTAPTNVLAKEVETDQEEPAVLLTWDESPDADFNYFAVVRGDESGFDPETAEVVGTTVDPTFTDLTIDVGEDVFYRVVAFDFNNNRGEFSEEVSLTITSVDDSDQLAGIPEDFALHQNYPNPFNPETNIAYDLPDDVHVTLKIYNLMGQEVRTLVDEQQPAGRYTVTWDGTSSSGVKVASGVYLFVIRAGEFVQSERMTLLK